MKTLEIQGHKIQSDASGQGHCWRDIPADDTLGGCLAEVEAEVMESGDEAGKMIAQNGMHYRWLPVAAPHGAANA